MFEFKVCDKKSTVGEVWEYAKKNGYIPVKEKYKKSNGDVDEVIITFRKTSNDFFNITFRKRKNTRMEVFKWKE